MPATEPRRFSATRTPWDTTRTPGGSSGGAGIRTGARVSGRGAIAEANCEPLTWMFYQQSTTPSAADLQRATSRLQAYSRRLVAFFVGDDGLPLAVQRVAPPLSAGALLALAAHLEDACPWASRVAPTTPWQAE